MVDGTGKPGVVGFVGYAPFDIVVLVLHPVFLQGGRHPLEFLNALIIVGDKYPGDVPMALPNEQADQLLGAAQVVDHHPGAFQVFVIVVIKNNGDALLIDPPVAVQVGIQQAGLYPVHDKALKALVHHRVEAPALIGELVVREEGAQVHLVGGKNAADAVHETGVGVAVLSLEDETDLGSAAAAPQLPGQGRLFFDIGAAPPHPAEEALLLQPGQGPAHRLPADGQLPAQGVFGGDF